jgi:hypothetical protein
MMMMMMTTTTTAMMMMTIIIISVWATVPQSSSNEAIFDKPKVVYAVM